MRNLVMIKNINNHLLPIIGAIAGDIIGSPYELNGSRIKSKEFPLFSQQSTYTDDTVMTLGVAQWVMNNNENLTSILHIWGNKYINVGFGHAFKCWLRSENPQPYNSWGNGSAMRVSSIGVACEYLHDVLNLAEQSASITHNHLEGIKGAQAVAVAVFLAYKGFSKQNIKAYIEKTFNYDLSRDLNQIREIYSFDSSCQGSVPEAIIAFLHSDNFEDAVRLAVSLGGDADTQASIAGAIAASFYKKIPQNIISETFSKLPNELRDIIYLFNDYVTPQNVSLAVTSLESVILKSKIQYSFALACTDVIDVYIPKGTRLELASIPPLVKDEEKYATLHLLNNRERIFDAIEHEARLKYPEFTEDYDHLVERIMLFSKIADLEKFDVSALTMDDLLANA